MKNRQRLSAAPVCLLFFLALIPAVIKADSLFGNTPDGSYGYGIYASYPYPYVSGAAVSFTLAEDITISSVTLYLSNYTQSFGLQLLEGTNVNSLSPVGVFSSSATNNGSLSAFTFSLIAYDGTNWLPSAATLSAGDTYWLFAYGSSKSSGTIEWVGGTTPTGSAAFNGTALYYGSPAGNFMPALNATAPSFTINAVPEPSALTLIAAGGVAVRLFTGRKKVRRGLAGKK